MYKLDAAGVDHAAENVFSWLSFYLFIAIVFIYQTAESFLLKKSADALPEKLSDGSKYFFGAMILFGLFITLAVSGDVFRLALTFVSWGTFILLLVLSLTWIIARWFFLSRDDIAAYTIEADNRTAVDRVWQKQAKEKGLLLKGLLLWFCGDAFAIGWLMHLTNRDLSSLLSFLHS